MWACFSRLLCLTMFQNFYLIDAHLCGLLIIVTSRRLLYFFYKEVWNRLFNFQILLIILFIILWCG